MGRAAEIVARPNSIVWEFGNVSRKKTTSFSSYSIKGYRWEIQKEFGRNLENY